MIQALDFLILGLATWRLSSLLAREDGPWIVFARFRSFVGVRYNPSPPFEAYGSNVLASGLLCIWCNSVWIGFLFALIYWFLPAVVFLALPLALSTITICIDQYVTIKQ